MIHRKTESASQKFPVLRASVEYMTVWSLSSLSLRFLISKIRAVIAPALTWCLCFSLGPCGSWYYYSNHLLSSSSLPIALRLGVPLWGRKRGLHCPHWCQPRSLFSFGQWKVNISDLCHIPAEDLGVIASMSRVTQGLLLQSEIDSEDRTEPQATCSCHLTWMRNKPMWLACWQLLRL